MGLYEIKVMLYLTWYAISDFGVNLFHLRRKCKSEATLDGRVVVITGANTGIGKETAYQLSDRGAKVIIGCRDVKKGENAVQDIKERNPSANIVLLRLDLSSLSSVREFAKTVSAQESRIDILINNAGLVCPEKQSEDGFELQFATNHLGHFLLTLSLLHLIRKSPNARIINLSSGMHMIGKIHFNNINLRNNEYTRSKAYSQSKLANILFTRELARRLGKNSNINTYAVHPGAVRTEFLRDAKGLEAWATGVMSALFFIDVDLGSQTTLYCALEESLDNETGFYYDNCRRIEDKSLVSRATDDESAKMLWELSCDLVKLEDNFKI